MLMLLCKTALLILTCQVISCYYSTPASSNRVTNLPAHIDEAPNMLLKASPLPESQQPPSYTEMADLLIQLLPEADHPQSHSLLVDKILPLSLSSMSDHPRPHRLAEVVYEELAEELEESEPNQRLNVLKAAASRAEIRAQSVNSLSMAISRYLQEHPEATDKATDWLNSTVEKYRSLPTTELEAEAAQQLKKLEDWEALVQVEYPEIWQNYRLTFIQTKLNWQSAHSGSFATATGSFYDFLLEMGETVENLAIY